MTRTELYWIVKDAIITAAHCPDGGSRACASCAADAAIDALMSAGLVNVDN